jgi:hypothetical protein
MTYDELMAMYMQAGGGVAAPLYGGSDGGNMQEQMMPVQLPDGRYMIPSGDGFQFTDPTSSSAPGGVSTGSYIGRDGVSTPYSYTNPESRIDRRLGLSLVGGMALGGLGLESGLLGSAASSGSGAAASGAGASEAATLAAAENGLLGSTVGMSPGTAAAYGTGTAASGAALGSTAGAAAGTGAAGAGAAGTAAASGAGRALGSTGELLAAGAGAAAAIAGNDDMDITTSTSGTSSNTTAGTSGSTGASNASTQGNSSTSLAPWLQPYAQDYVGRARELANGPTSNEYLDRSGSLLMGAADDPLVQAARQQQQNVISGGLLNSNPYIDQVAKGISDRMGEGYATGTRGSLTSGAQMSGNDPRYSSAYAQTVGNADRAFGDALGQTMSGLYMGNYNQERAAQDAASRNSTMFGQYNQQSARDLADFGQTDWMRPYQQNQFYGNSINPAFGSQQQNTSNMTGNNSLSGWNNSTTNGTTTGTQTQNIQAPNNWMAGTGGALAGAGIYRSIFG